MTKIANPIYDVVFKYLMFSWGCRNVRRQVFPAVALSHKTPALRCSCVEAHFASCETNKNW